MRLKPLKLLIAEDKEKTEKSGPEVLKKFCFTFKLGEKALFDKWGK